MSESEDVKKAVNQFGEEIQDVQEERKFVNIRVSEKQWEQIRLDQHNKFSKSDLTKKGMFIAALVLVKCAKAMLSLASKEKAKEALAKAVYDFSYMEGRAAAEKLGNPKDLNSFCQYEAEGMAAAPFIPPNEILEMPTKNRLYFGIRTCPLADSIRAIGEMFPEYADQDVLEIAVSHCKTMDKGRAIGFNPDIKFEKTHSLLSDLEGEGPAAKGCYFVAEVTEE